MKTNKISFTVCTPTYNRAHLLPKVFASLENQTFRDFEWLVVDDGSTDNTRETVVSLRDNSPFPVRYCFQENSGVHGAFNAGVKEARGTFFVYLNDDDWLCPTCLERMQHHWQQLSPAQMAAFVGVAALCTDPAGILIGTAFPEDVFDCDAIDIRLRHHVQGDKIGMNRTEILRQFPFPADLDRSVPMSLVWNRIAQKYKIRFVNEVLAGKDYLKGGLTDKKLSNKIRHPRATVVHLSEMISSGRPLPFAFLLKSYANYIRFSLHASYSPGKQLADVPSYFLWLLASPLGVGAYLRDRCLKLTP